MAGYCVLKLPSCHARRSVAGSGSGSVAHLPPPVAAERVCHERKDNDKEEALDRSADKRKYHFLADNRLSLHIAA